jgi:hypothetical protein
VGNSPSEAGPRPTGASLPGSSAIAPAIRWQAWQKKCQCRGLDVGIATVRDDDVADINVAVMARSAATFPAVESLIDSDTDALMPSEGTFFCKRWLSVRQRAVA